MHKIVYALMGQYNSQAFKSRFLYMLYIKSAYALKVWAAVFVGCKMYDEESDEIWITQSRFSKTDCAFNVND